MDLASGYWQLAMDPQDAAKTAFITFEGLFQLKVVLFSLSNAPATFDRIMKVILVGLNWKCLIYIDVISFAESFQGYGYIGALQMSIVLYMYCILRFWGQSSSGYMLLV